MIFVYPTDTAYALGCDARDDYAVRKIFEIKKRKQEKTLPLIASSIEMARDWCELSGKAEDLAKKYWPGALTLVLPVKKQGLSALVVNNGAVAIRVPDSKDARDLSEKLGALIVSTSANKAGDENPYSIEDVKKSLSNKINLVDQIIDKGELKKRESSTIIKIDKDNIEVVRKGAVSIPTSSRR
ncbi:threonylcarbamoyl-AMP synthase [Patescibacteria group bacterium]|nr:threonylcarbamoyl-AMP synthase [Patescibacteria group bacterium]